MNYKHGRVTRQELGRAARYDASYVTLMARGRVPSQDGARRMASALLAIGARREDVDLWLWLCGYVPGGVSATYRDAILRGLGLSAYRQRPVAAAMRHAIREQMVAGDDEAVDETPPRTVPPQSMHPRRPVTTRAERLREALG